MALSAIFSKTVNKVYRLFGSYDELPKHKGVRVFVARNKRTRESFGNALAFCLGDQVYVKSYRQWTDRIKRHELAHVHQFKRMGLVFPVAYLWELHTRGYWENRFEKEARRAERLKPKKKR